MPSKNGAVWRAHFWCHILWTIWLDYDKRGANKKKEMRPQKIETREAQMNATKIWVVLKLEMGLNLAVLRPDRLQMQMCDTKFQSSLDWQGLDLQWPGPSRVLSGPSRVPSGPHLQWSGPFGSSSGPLGSSFRLVGSHTLFGFYKDTTIGVECARYLQRFSGCGRYLLETL